MLAGRCDSESVEGVVLLNGRPLPENFHCASGYVIQVCEFYKWLMCYNVHFVMQ